MIGTSLAGRYTVVSELGRGGMGVVYRARDGVLSRDVAVKLVPPQLVGPATRERFQREAQLVARLDHPAIIAIHDFGDHEGSLFLVMPVVEGRSLRALLAHGPRPLDEVLEIGIQLAEALDYSHARGVVHRDIKPENVMLTGGEGGLRVRVMDFGLALTAASDRLTQTGGLIGTPAYLSPEQLAGGEVDGRADVYAMAVVLYEALAGEAPFTGIPYSLLYRIAHEPPQPLRERGVAVPPAFESVLLACLAKRRDERPARAGDVAEALRQLRAGKMSGGRPGDMVSTLAFAAPKNAGPQLIGRGRELAELQRHLLAMTAGECHFVAIGGEAGMGKSRLLEELDRLAKARELPVLHGRFAEYDRALPFHGFTEVIRHYFRTHDGADVADFRDLAGDLLAFFPVLSEVPALRAAASEPSASHGGEDSRNAARGADDRTYLFELLAKTLARCAGGKPLVVLLEHLHDADVSVEALRYLLLRLAATPLLVVATYRTTDLDRRHPLRSLLADLQSEPRSAHLLLQPLAAADCERLAHEALGGTPLEPRLASRLFAASEGNPLFLLELLRSLVESGGMTRDASGSWHLSGAGALTPAALPATVQQAVERRLMRLPEEQRELLTLASVLGRGFDLRDLEALVEDRSHLEAQLDRLVAEGLLEEDRSSRSDRLSFSSGVLRDVLYAGIPRRRRRSLHQRVAEHLERRWAGRLERVVPQLFFHCEQGDLAEKCVEYGLAAARFQLDAFSPDDATRTLRTVLEFLRDEGFEGTAGVEAEARRLLAGAYRQAGDVAASLAELETALARSGDDPRRRLELISLAAATAWEGRRIPDTQRWVEEGVAAARAAGDRDELQRLLTLGATVANLAGRQLQATEYLAELESLEPAHVSATDLPRGGVARVGMPLALRAAEPVRASTVEEAEVLATVFETLVTTDARGILLPHLAERWEALDGGAAYAITLRPNVLLHDGRPLTAERVRESLLRAAEIGRNDPPAALAALRGGREGAPAIAVTGERELRLELVEPLAIFPAMLTDLRTAVAVPLHGGAAANDGDAPGAQPPLAGTGPFKMGTVAGDRVVVDRWEKHWRTAPRVDAVEFRGGISAALLAQGVRDGSLDLAHGLEPEALEEAARDRHLGMTVLESPRRSLYFLLFSAGGALGNSRGARRALGGVLRLHDFVHAALGRLAQPAAGVLPPGVLGHDSSARRPPLQRDEAEGLLIASGLRRPLHLRAAVHPVLQDRYAAVTAAFLLAWNELGIDVQVVTRTLADYQTAIHHAVGPDEQPLDLLLGRWIANYDDPDSFIGELFHSRGGYFRAWTRDSALDEAMERARSEAEPSARERLYRRLEGSLAEDARVVPLFHDLDCRIAGPRLRHVVLRGTLPFVGYAELAVGEPPARQAVARRGRRGALRIPSSGRMQTLDPAQTIFTWQANVIPTVFETLTRENEAAQIAPFLAAKVEAAEQGRRFRFRLREDVRFHDGRPLTARDVRWSFMRMLKSKANENRWLLSSIVGARQLIDDGQGELPGLRVESDHELSIELEKAVSVFPALLAHPSTAIVPEGADAFDGNWSHGVVGTGPFRVTHFAPGARLELEANPGYWRPGLPRSQRLVFSFGWSPGEMAAALRAGELSLVTQLPLAEVEELRRDARMSAQHHEIPTLSTYYLVLNAHQGPLADEAVRHELLASLDVPALVQRHIGRLGVPARGLVPPGLLGNRGQYRPAPTPAPRPGATSGDRELTVLLQTAYNELYPELTKALLQAIAARGFKVNVIELKSSYRELIATTRVDIFLARWVADYPDADTFLYHLLHSQDGLLGHFLGDAEIDRLIDQGRRETSPEVRHDLYLAVERRLAERALLQPLFHEQSHCFVRPEVRGFARRFASVDVDHALLWVE
ncbi:MAG TPA: ABC transporter substrate-binding protein [Thermoanaerobaculia bacterium]|nr:ABC transporter substrate-binding protein [Thermoanaerobaculia bacterium]